ncbi:MAG: sulfatase-like hydrolase/transferase [Kiritimatiellales bacterium]|nr:sulfatase-like hydrolase/transferase [Kiritimatiellales bacterium]
MKLYIWATFLTMISATLLFAAAPQQPNVVLVMTDDQGYGDIGSHGNPFLKTPNLDRLASQSVRLDDYHASPYCVPSRATLMTGRYADRTGVKNRLNTNWFVRTDETMVGTMFQNAGYATGMFGKWHLGDNYPYRPEDKGFGEVLRHHGGAIGVMVDYWDNCYVDDTYYSRNGKPVKVEGYCTDVFFDAATRFIEKNAKAKKPFFVYLATNAPHGPRICPPAYSEPYAKGKTRRTATFYGMIANIDENVGRLRAYLQKRGLAENTIFIFTTDNGTAGGQSVFNAEMRGHKMEPYEGGHRVPFFLHWPGGGFDSERRIETLTAQIDVAPTLLDLCGIPQPKGNRFDGTSLRPLLEKGDHPGWPDRIVMTDGHNKQLPTKWFNTAVMTERWRLVDGKELYDIETDPGQKENIYAKHPEVVERLSRHYDSLWDEFQLPFQNAVDIPLTEPGARTVALNYHDCMDRHFFWHQSDIRTIEKWIDKPSSDRTPAYWPVRVGKDGEYRIELRRWPVELDRPIHADIPPGAKVYGRNANRTRHGIGFPAIKANLAIGDQLLTTSVDKQTKAAVFQTKLTAGSYRLSARFHDAEGRSLDAFYVYVSESDGHSEVHSAPKRANPIEEGSDGITCHHDFLGLEANEFSFDPIVAKFVRIVIHDSIKSRPPCIDELEIFRPGATGNLAMKYGLPSASSSLGGYEKHRIEHLNDGKYGNLHSWICGEKTGWCQIELTKKIKIDRVVLSRDRDGRLEDRSPLSFDIQVSKDGKDWETVKKIRPANGTSAKNNRSMRSLHLSTLTPSTPPRCDGHSTI